MTTSLLKAKFVALFLNLLCSTAIIFLSAVIVYLTWYPSIHFFVDGGFQGLSILALVQVILGPILTFISYAPEKSKLKLDMVIIATIQIFCFIAGLAIIYSERPLAIALSGDTFHTANRISYDFYGQSPDYLESIPGSYPKRLYVTSSYRHETSPLSRIQRTPDRLNKNQISALSNKLPEAKAQGLTLESFIEHHAEHKKTIEKTWERYKKSHPNAKFYKLFAKHRSTFCLFDADSDTFLQILPFEVPR